MSIIARMEDPKYANLDEAQQISAGFAAVYAYIDSEKQTAQEAKRCANRSSTATEYPKHKHSSAWGKAAILEAVSGKKFLPMILSFFAVLSCVQPSIASDHEQEPRTKKTAPIRVALAINTSSAQLGTPDGAHILHFYDGQAVAFLPNQTQWQLGCDRDMNFLVQGDVKQPMPGKPRIASEPDIIPASFTPNSPLLKFNIDVVKDQALLKLPSKEATEISQAAYLFVPQTDTGLLAFNGKLYRGYFLVYPAKEANKFNVINIVSLEDYLLSVVPSEMPSLWPLESLKAQAIAARSYAIANLGKNEKLGFDVKATVEDQVYLGVQTETQATNIAVIATEGMVLKHEGKPISAFFHSSSGGWTDLAENVWSKPVAYLKSVPDFDDASPNFAWERSFVPEAVEKAFLINGIDLGQILHFDCPLQSEAGRNRFILITGTKKAKLVSGEGLRKILNLPSSSFNIGSREDKYVIAGRGFGHGLGMSQWGAKQLAEHGYNAAQILSYYYKDVNLDNYQ